MESLTLKSFKEGKGFWADREEDIKELEAQGLTDDSIIINFAYTDYGGHFIDRVAIEFFKNEKCFRAYDTVYYGQNAILWGDVAKAFKEQSQNYPLGYAGLEDFYYQKEYEAQATTADELLEDYKNEEGEPLTAKAKQDCFGRLIDILSGYSIMSSGCIDFCESEVIEKLEDFLNGDYQLILSKDREAKLDSQYYQVIK
jgi:hypothetical protein